MDNQWTGQTLECTRNETTTKQTRERERYDNRNMEMGNRGKINEYKCNIGHGGSMRGDARGK